MKFFQNVKMFYMKRKENEVLISFLQKVGNGGYGFFYYSFFYFKNNYEIEQSM